MVAGMVVGAAMRARFFAAASRMTLMVVPPGNCSTWFSGVSRYVMPVVICRP